MSLINAGSIGLISLWGYCC